MSTVEKCVQRLSYYNKKFRADRMRNRQGRIIRWGIIGLGNMANVFAKALQVVPDAYIAAVASRNGEKARAFAKKYRVTHAYGSYEAMLCDKALNLDIVYIATPNKYHYQHIKLVLEHGLNVICEKPITANADELIALKRIADEKGLFFMEGMWTLCLPVHQVAKEWIEAGKIGTLQAVRIDLSKREIVDTARSIFSPEEGGGVLMDYGIYTIAFALWLLGEKTEIEYVQSFDAENGIDKSWYIVLANNGIKAFITIASDIEGDRKAVAIGTSGSIEWESQFNRTNKICRYYHNGRKAEEFSVPYKFMGIEYEIQEVHRCIKNNLKESKLVPYSSVLKTMQFADHLRKAMS